MDWTTVIMLAVITETIVEHLKTAIPGFSHVKWAVMLASLGLGILLAFVSGANVLTVLGIAQGIPYVGNLLTGIVIAGGSNMIYDLMSRVKGGRETVLAPSLAIPEGNSTIANHEDMGVM